MDISNSTLQEAKTLATSWQEKIEKSRENEEKKFHEMMIRMLEDPLNKVFLIELLDQSFRASNTDRVADQIEHIFSKYENSNFFSLFEQTLIWTFRHLGIYITSLSVPAFINYLRNDISALVLKAEDSVLNQHIKRRKAEGTRVNINVIGETVLGEQEAQERVQHYISILKNPNIDYISIKISTLFSQISSLAHEWSIHNISQPLESIYREAMSSTYLDKEGKECYKFVNLDMEEYKDLSLTIDLFKKVLSQKEFESLHAGIVLQAYLPDTLECVKELVAWAKERVLNGGAPIKIRLVKGANQEMELTESSLRGWPCVTYLDKAQTDANFKILMDYLLDKELAPYVHVGIASHNLFDHALAFLIVKERGLHGSYTAEMLEGMSEAAYHLLQDENINVILYAPTATRETFTNAIAYLVRRFDENTAEQNFLRHCFGLSVDSSAWKKLLRSYDEALGILPYIPLRPYRTQDRRDEIERTDIDPKGYIFKNESDTDFILPQNQEWAQEIARKWKNISKKGGFHAHTVVAGEESSEGEKVDVIDKSQYHEKIIIGSYTKATQDEIEKAILIAQQDPDGWRDLDIFQRQHVLMQVADEFRRARADLIGIAAAEVGKVFTETDVEISEAVDFLNFYPYSVRSFSKIEGVQLHSKGVGLVISPWNFPIAIPVGGIAAALATGNTVILKPASTAVLCAYSLCQCFWNAGVSKNTLQLLPASAELASEFLTPSKAIDFCIFTGGEKTVYKIIKSRPEIHLSAETGGKNATIVTAMADRDQALKNVIASAFNNSGQKCSATSLLVLEREVYEDKRFKEMLIDATESLKVGSVWDLHNRIGALSSLPANKLKKALDYLEEHESWLIEPSFVNDNPYFLRPCIRWGTQEGDFTHMNELFGPVLSVMCADDLDHAISIVNATGYGLTSGLESLDKREQEKWKENIQAGNLYINRVTTGAIVMRQPFGGMNKSAFGAGKKAGGFNYVSEFMHMSCDARLSSQSSTTDYINDFKQLFKQEDIYSKELQDSLITVSGFAYWIEKEFSKEHDYVHLRGENNIFRYRGVKSVLLCLEESDKLHDILVTIISVKMIGAKIHISLPQVTQNRELLWLEQQKRLLLDDTDIISRESEDQRIDAMYTVERIRFLQPKNVNQSIYNKISDNPLYIACKPFITHPRLELMHYYIEQSISDSFHRYGNLGLQGLKG